MRDIPKDGCEGDYPPVPAATIDTAAPVIIFPTDKQNIGLHHYLAFFLLVEVISPYFSFPLVNLQTFVLNPKKLSIIETIASGHSTLKKTKQKKTKKKHKQTTNYILINILWELKVVVL